MRIIIPVIILLNLMFCNSKDDFKNQLFEEKITVEFGEYVLSTTFFWFSVDYRNGKPVYLFIDELDNLVEIELDNHILKNTIRLPKDDGPLGIKGIIRTPSLGNDQDYLLEGAFHYFVVDQTGSLKLAINFEKKINDKLQDISKSINGDLLFLRRAGNFKYNNKFIVALGRTRKDRDREFPDFPQFAMFEFSNDYDMKVEILDIRYPKEILGSNYKYVGQSEIPNYFFSGDWLVYNFSSFKEVFFFNVRTREERKISLKTNFDIEDRTIPYRESPNFEHLVYGWPLVDFKSEYIYRFHILIDPDNPMESKNFLGVYDFKGDLLSELFLGKNSERMLRNPVLVDDYVYMNNFHQNSDDRIEFSRFKLFK